MKSEKLKLKQKQATDYIDNIRSLRRDNTTLTGEQLANYAKCLRFMRRTSFRWFAEYIAPEFDARITKFYPFQIDVMERMDEAFYNPSARIIYVIPPQSFKSVVTTWFTAFYFGRHPDARSATVTFNATRAKENTAILTQVMDLPRYKELFKTRIKSSMDAEEKKQAQVDGQIKSQSARGFKIVGSYTGEYKALGVGEGFAGYSPQLVILDDYFSSMADGDSLVLRSQLWDWFTAICLGRAQITGTQYLIPCTRYHADDIIGMIERKKAVWVEHGLPDWDIISYPAIMEDEGGNNYDPRKNGELLIPEHKEKYIIAKLDNPRVFYTMYQGKPPSSNGLLFTRDYIQYYNVLPSNIVGYVVSIDTNLVASVNSDDCAISVWARTSDNIHYLVEFWHRPMSFTETKSFLRNTVMIKYPAGTKILIEQKSNGYALLDDMKELGYQVIPYIVSGHKNKRVRLEEALPVFVAKQVMFPHREICHNVDVIINQLMQFTGAKGDKDDLVDTLTQYLNTFADRYAIRYDPDTIMEAANTTFSDLFSVAGLTQYNPNKGFIAKHWGRNNPNSNRLGGKYTVVKKAG